MLTGCTDDAFESNKRKPVDQIGVPEGFVRAHVNMIASGFETVQTKSLTSQQEHNWTHVVVGQFDANNELIDASVKQYVPDESGNFNVILANSGVQITLFISLPITVKPTVIWECLGIILLLILPRVLLL